MLASLQSAVATAKCRCLVERGPFAVRYAHKKAPSLVPVAAQPGIVHSALHTSVYKVAHQLANVLECALRAPTAKVWLFPFYMHAWLRALTQDHSA